MEKEDADRQMDEAAVGIFQSNTVSLSKNFAK
jgi:hypothetical protein